MKDNMISSLFSTSDVKTSTMIDQECSNEDSTSNPNDIVEEVLERSLLYINTN
jgi:hypothetical protein